MTNFLKLTGSFSINLYFLHMKFHEKIFTTIKIIQLWILAILAHLKSYLKMYSTVWNKHAACLFEFHKFFLPTCPYFRLHVYLISRIFPSYMFIPSYMFFALIYCWVSWNFCHYTTIWTPIEYITKCYSCSIKNIVWLPLCLNSNT